MIITIANDNGETLYDINKINDDNKKQEATIIIISFLNISKFIIYIYGLKNNI